MKMDNEKQLLATGVYEAPKCEVIEMMGEGSLLLEASKVNPPEELSRRSSYDEDEDY